MKDMADKKLLKTGLIGSAVMAVCCFTPVLVLMRRVRDAAEAQPRRGLCFLFLRLGQMPADPDGRGLLLIFKRPLRPG